MAVLLCLLLVPLLAFAEAAATQVIQESNSNLATQVPDLFVSLPSSPAEESLSSVPLLPYPAGSKALLQSLAIRKCCPVGQVFSHSHAGCTESSHWDFSVPVFAQTDFGSFQERNVTKDQVTIKSGLLECDQQFQLDVFPDQEPSFHLRVLDSGWLWVPEYDAEYSPEHYCLEVFVNDASDGESPTIVGGAVCVVQEEPQLFDPTKIPIRKCCPLGMVYDQTEFSCVLRANITDEEWLAPLAGGANGSDVALVSLFSSEYQSTHEIVAHFQTCPEEQQGTVLRLQHGQASVRAADGMLWLSSLHRYISPTSYCLEDIYTDDMLLPSVYLCVAEEEAMALLEPISAQCEKGQCIPKCCPAFQVLDRAMQTCVPQKDRLEELFLYHLNGTAAHSLSSPDFSIGFPSCGNQYLTSRGESAQLLPDGGLRYVSINTDECEPEQVFRVPGGDYCYERIEDIDGSVMAGAVLCFKEDWTHLGITDAEEQEVYFVYAVFLAISDFFILVSLIVYITVPDQTQRGLNKNVKLAHSILGRILLCFLFSLFFAYLCLIIIKTASDPINLASGDACIALGVCTYVFFMATFFWLNVLCFELWWKCSRQETVSSGRRWGWYQLYGWCCPLIFGCVAVFMELSPDVSNCYIKPKFGTYSCFFSHTMAHNNGAKWAYFFGPVAVLLLWDLLFFVLTVRCLLRTVQQSHKGTVQKQARQRLKLCFKLFLVMGISWLAEIVSFQLGPRSAWYISDIINCFQGFIIFMIFILKPKILAAVRLKLFRCCCRHRSQPLGHGSSHAPSLYTERFPAHISTLSSPRSKSFPLGVSLPSSGVLTITKNTPNRRLHRSVANGSTEVLPSNFFVREINPSWIGSTTVRLQDKPLSSASYSPSSSSKCSSFHSDCDTQSRSPPAHPISWRQKCSDGPKAGDPSMHTPQPPYATNTTFAQPQTECQPSLHSHFGRVEN